jgi:hypothetical protein
VRPLVELNAAGEAAEFTVTAPVAGRYEITIPQYKLTGAKPQLELRLNGSLVGAFTAVQTVTNTNDFGREGQTTFVAELAAGPNILRIDSLTSGVVRLNSLRIAQP